MAQVAHSVRLQMAGWLVPRGSVRPAWHCLTLKVARRYMSDTSSKHDAPSAVGTRLETGLRNSRRAEFFVFAIIAAFIWPVVAVGVVGGYGFLIWMIQVIVGPPGPPGA
jgi:periplasmic nitrate reductase NapE